MMKRIISISLAVVFALSLCSCVSSDEKKEDNVTETTTVKESAPVITLSADKVTVEPGDTVRITLNIKNAPKTACYDIKIIADNALTYVSSEECPMTGMINEAKYYDEGDAHLLIQGMVATSCDLLDTDIFVIEYTVSEDAESGKEFSVDVLSDSFLLAEDESGDKTYEAVSDVTYDNVVIKVK